jgi:FkbM family methyltransferase
MLDGSFDTFLYDALKGQCELRGACCWDIGAHVGYHTLCFAAMGAQVLCFEPNRANADRLKLHLEKNPELGARVRPFVAAISDRDGEMTFLQSDNLNDGSMGSHLVEGSPPCEASSYARFQKVTVPTLRLDTLLERGEKSPDLIKLDVEGAEYLALMGGRNLLRTKKALLFIEVHHICLMLEVQQLLLDLGYQLRIVDREHASPSRCFIMAVAT